MALALTWLGAIGNYIAALQRCLQWTSFGTGLWVRNGQVLKSLAVALAACPLVIFSSDPYLRFWRPISIRFQKGTGTTLALWPRSSILHDALTSGPDSGKHPKRVIWVFRGCAAMTLIILCRPTTLLRIQKLVREDLRLFLWHSYDKPTRQGNQLAAQDCSASPAMVPLWQTI